MVAHEWSSSRAKITGRLSLEFVQRVRFGIRIEQHCIAIARAGRKKSEDVSGRARVDRLGVEYLSRRRQFHKRVSAFGIGNDEVSVR